MKVIILIWHILSMLILCNCAGHTGGQGGVGLTGPSGTSCTVTTLLPSHDNPTGGALLSCGSQSVVVVNGAANGTSAAYTVVGSIDPCGASNSGQDEIFLRMASGALIAL